MKISGCMIVKNESRCIARCIESFERVVDEVVVVDTGSEDDTVAIAEAHGAKVFHFKWINDFSKAKNYALDQCAGDWVLFFDADEYLQEDQDLAIREYIEELHGNRKIHGLLTVMSNIDPVEGRPDQYRILTEFDCVRVFRNSPLLRFRNAIHEALYHSKSDLKLFTVPIAKVNILHDGYRATVETKKASRNLETLLEDHKGGTGMELTPFYIGREYCTLHKYEDAIPYLEEYIDSKYWHKYIGLWTERLLLHAYEKTGRPLEEQMDFVKLTLEKHPDNPTAEYIMGDYLARSNDLLGCIEHLQRSLDILGDDPRKYDAFPLEYTTNSYNNVLNRLGRIALMRGNEEAAHEYFIKGVKFDRSYAPNLTSALWMMRDKGEQTVMSFLEEHYDFNLTKHLNLLTSTLRQRRPGMVFLACFEKYYQRIQQQDVNFLTMLTVIGEYKMALDGYLKRYKLVSENLYYIKAFACAMLAQSDSMLAQVAYASPEHAPFVDAYTSSDPITNVKDITLPVALLIKEILSLIPADSPPLARLIKCIPLSLAGLIAPVLNDFDEYSATLELAERAQDSDIDLIHPMELYYQSTYAAIQKNDIPLADKYYQMALDAGYSPHGMAIFAEFLEKNR